MKAIAVSWYLYRAPSQKFTTVDTHLRRAWSYLLSFSPPSESELYTTEDFTCYVAATFLSWSHATLVLLLSYSSLVLLVTSDTPTQPDATGYQG